MTHVDPVSGVPLPHLSYLLVHMIPKEALIFRKVLSEGNEQSQYVQEVIGSTGDLTKCVLGDITIDESMKSYHQKMRCTCSIVSTQKKLLVGCRKESTKSCDLIAEDASSHPGYCRLRPVNPDPMYWGEILIKMESGDSFLAGQCEGNEVKSYTGYICADWPKQSTEWLLRARPVSWPSRALIEKLCKEKCLVIPRPHPFSDHPALEWQYVFFRAEKLLFFEGLTEDQRQCYNVFNVVVNFFCRHISWQLSSTHLKAIFFYACEVIPQSYWTDSFGGCYLYLVASALRCVQNRNIPNYFIKENNMIDHMECEALAHLETALESIRQFPMESAAFLIERHGYRDGWFTTNTIMEDIPTYMRERRRNLNRVVQRVFVPTTLKLAMKQANREKYVKALELVGHAYDELLATPPPPDARDTRMPKDIHHFLKEVISNIDCVSVRHLFGEYINEVSGKDVVPLATGENVLYVRDLTGGNDIGGLGNVPVPNEYSTNSFNHAVYLDKLAYNLYNRFKDEDAASYLGYAVDSIEKALTHDVVDPSSIEDPVMRSEVSAQSYQNTFNWSTYLINILQHFECIYMRGHADTLSAKLVQVQEICDRFPNPAVLKYVIDLWCKLGYNDMAVQLQNKLAAIGGETMDMNYEFGDPYNQTRYI